MEEDKSECAIKKQKDVNNEVTYAVTNYVNAFNVLECGRKLLDRLGLLYERACMATPREALFMEMWNSLLRNNHLHGTPLSSKKLQEAVRRVMEEEQKYAERNVNNVTTDTLFQSTVTINVQNTDANMIYERWIASGILTETIK